LYFDTNENGQFGPGEMGVPGRLVFLDRNNNGLREVDEPNVRSQYDDVNTPFNEAGVYEFVRLPAGAYGVWILQEPDSIQQSPIGNALNAIPTKLVTDRKASPVADLIETTLSIWLSPM
jgi:hypothetical protein